MAKGGEVLVDLDLDFSDFSGDEEFVSKDTKLSEQTHYPRDTEKSFVETRSNEEEQEDNEEWKESKHSSLPERTLDETLEEGELREENEEDIVTTVRSESEDSSEEEKPSKRRKFTSERKPSEDDKPKKSVTQVPFKKVKQHHGNFGVNVPHGFAPSVPMWPPLPSRHALLSAPMVFPPQMHHPGMLPLPNRAPGLLQSPLQPPLLPQPGMLPTPPMPPNPYFMQRMPHNLHGQSLMHSIPPSFGHGPISTRDHSDDSRTPLDRPKEHHRTKELHRDSQHKSTSRNHDRSENSRPKNLTNEHSKPRTDFSHKDEHLKSEHSKTDFSHKSEHSKSDSSHKPERSKSNSSHKSEHSASKAHKTSELASNESGGSKPASSPSSSMISLDKKKGKGGEGPSNRFHNY